MPFFVIHVLSSFSQYPRRLVVFIVSQLLSLEVETPPASLNVSIKIEKNFFLSLKIVKPTVLRTSFQFRLSLNPTSYKHVGGLFSAGGVRGVHRWIVWMAPTFTLIIRHCNLLNITFKMELSVKHL